MNSFLDGYNSRLLQASRASINSRPKLWWQHAHGFANNAGNRTFNILKGVAGEAIAATAAYSNFAKYLTTMKISEKFQNLNDPDGEFEGGLSLGGTWDYSLRLKRSKFDLSAGMESPILDLITHTSAGVLGHQNTWNLSISTRFLFEIKTLSADASVSSLYLNIKKGYIKQLQMQS